MKAQAALVIITVHSSLCVKLFGVFERSADEQHFLNTAETKTTANHINYDSLLVTNNTNTSLVLGRLCKTQDVSLFYMIGSSPLIQIVKLAADSIGVPIAVFDRSRSTPNKLTQEGFQRNVVYMNNNLYQEGRIFAELAEKSNLRYVNLLLDEKLQYDGLLDGFRSRFDTDFGRNLDIHYFSKDESANRLLIMLLQSFNEQTDRTYFIYDVVLLHIDPETAAEVIDGAQLLFYDRQIIWLISSYSRFESDSLYSGMVTLLQAPTDEIFISESTTKIIQQLNDSATNPNNTWLLSNRSCDSLNDDSRPLRWLLTSPLVSDGVLTYMRYEVQIATKTTQARNPAWMSLGYLDPFNSAQAYPSVVKPLGTADRQKYTVVTILDKPFVTENYPSAVDGDVTCQTPAKLCLKISKDVIKHHGYANDTVRNIFEDFYRGEKLENQSYTVTCCEGLAMDLLQSISAELDFEFQLYISPDSQFGAKDPDTLQWSGMVRELMDRRADMVMASFSITFERSRVVDYSAPYYHSGFAMLSIQRENEGQENLLAFLSPYPGSLWGMILLLLFVTSLFLALLDWLSPHGTNPSHEAEKSSYTLGSAIKTTWGQICGNILPSKTPQAWAAKVVHAFWSCFAIIILAGYTANLTSAIADKWSVTTVSGIYDDKLMNLRVAALRNSASESYVKLIKPELYRRLREHHITGTNDGVQALRDNNLDVFLHDTPVVEYLSSRENYDCTLTKLGSFAVDSYGAAFPANQMTTLKHAVSNKLLEYHESGYIEKLRRIYFPVSPNCVNPVSGQDSVQLSVRQAKGMLIFLCATAGICVVLIGAEHLIYKFFVPKIRTKPTTSCWKSKGLFFFSQRLYRSIMNTADNGIQVFINFARKIAMAGRLFTVQNKWDYWLYEIRQKPKSSFGKQDPRAKLTLYDVVAEAYERKYNRPLESIYLRNSSRVPKQLANLTKALALSTSGFTDVPEQEQSNSLRTDQDLAQNGFTSHPDSAPPSYVTSSGSFQRQDTRLTEISLESLNGEESSMNGFACSSSSTNNFIKLQRPKTHHTKPHQDRPHERSDIGQPATNHYKRPNEFADDYNHHRNGKKSPLHFTNSAFQDQ